jgi:hypothetical protein
MHGPPLICVANTVIRSLAAHLCNTAEDVYKSWEDAPQPPSGQRRQDPNRSSQVFPNSETMASGLRPGGSESRWPMERSSPGGESPVSLPTRSIAPRKGSDGSPGSDCSAPHVTYDAANLLARGKGQYVCPYGSECTRGGVRHGEIVIFERNSAFRFVNVDVHPVYH